MKITHILPYTTNIKEAKVFPCIALYGIESEESHAELKQ